MKDFIPDEVILENARKLHEENPDTFARDLTGVSVGAFVKICHSNLETPERFWVEVTAIDGKKIEGIVANELIFSWLDHGAHLKFELDNVYGVFTGKKGTGGEENNMRDVHKECNA
jgi:hypothetical protein